MAAGRKLLAAEVCCCVTEPPDILHPLEVVPLRPLNLSRTVFRLFLLTEVIPPPGFVADTIPPPDFATEVIPPPLDLVIEVNPLGFETTGIGFNKLAVGLGAIFGMVPAIWCVDIGLEGRLEAEVKFGVDNVF